MGTGNKGLIIIPFLYAVTTHPARVSRYGSYPSKTLSIKANIIPRQAARRNHRVHRHVDHLLTGNSPTG
jgi:hypothetical protein